MVYPMSAAASSWAVHLETPAGPVYIATDDADTTGLTGVVLTRSEIDGLLSVVTSTAPPNYLRRTLWLELNALVALKRSLLAGGPGSAVFFQPGTPSGQTVDLSASTARIPTSQPETQREQLSLLP